MRTYRVKTIMRLFLIAILFIPSIYFSQKKSKSKKPEEVVISASYLRRGDIKESGNLRGYYEYLAVDKPFKKVQNYMITLYDENYIKLNEIKFKESENYQMLNTAYSNEELCFMFFDNEKKNEKFEYKVFDMEGKLLNEVETKLTKKEVKSLVKHGTASQLINIEEGGFLSTSSINQKSKITFKINKLVKGSKQLLSYQFPVERKFNFPEILGVNHGVIITSITSKKTLNGKPIYNIVGVDVETMKERFLKSSEKDGEYIFKPYNLVENPDFNTVKISGTYFNVKDNTKKAAKGLAMWELDTSGVLLKEKYNAWIKDFGSFLTFKNNGKAKKFGYVKVHETFSTNDGKIFAIGEGYRKRFNGWSILTMLFQYPCFMSKFQTTDLALFEMDKDFNFKAGKILPKKMESFAGYGFATTNIHKLANQMHNLLGYRNMFGYKYVQLNEEKDAFMVSYTENNFVKFAFSYSAYFDKNVLNTLKFENGKYTSDKFLPKEEKAGGYSTYMRSQFGKLGVYTYDYKKRESSFRLIKVK